LCLSVGSLAGSRSAAWSVPFRCGPSAGSRFPVTDTLPGRRVFPFRSKMLNFRLRGGRGPNHTSLRNRPEFYGNPGIGIGTDGWTMATADSRVVRPDRRRRFRQSAVISKEVFARCQRSYVEWTEGTTSLQGRRRSPDHPEVGPVLIGINVSDPINHPKHYNSHPTGIECIDIIEHFPCNIANAMKYLWRCGLKGDEIEDLRKSAWFVNREIHKRIKERDQTPDAAH
jgi:hypothetical protein